MKIEERLELIEKYIKWRIKLDYINIQRMCRCPRCGNCPNLVEVEERGYTTYRCVCSCGRGGERTDGSGIDNYLKSYSSPYEAAKGWNKDSNYYFDYEKELKDDLYNLTGYVI